MKCLSLSGQNPLKFEMRPAEWKEIPRPGNPGIMRRVVNSMIHPHLLLASQSPRRQALLEWSGLDFRVVPGQVDEQPLPGEPPAAMAARLAAAKARTILAAGEWVLAADTTVALDGRALGKPADAAEARWMLQAMRGRSHQVHTGLALWDPATGRLALRVTTTRVWMRNYTDEEIAAYVATGDPLDKAGAYAVQHGGFHPVARLEGCYANVVGLPLCTLRTLWQAWGAAWKIDLPALCWEQFGYRCLAEEP